MCAGEKNRTPDYCLEGSRFTTKLHPRSERQKQPVQEVKNNWGLSQSSLGAQSPIIFNARFACICTQLFPANERLYRRYTRHTPHLRNLKSQHPIITEQYFNWQCKSPRLQGLLLVVGNSLYFHVTIITSVTL